MDDFDATAFLRDHWQKQPLLIRNPWAAWANPLDQDELAGLACMAQVESRLIQQVSDGLASDGLAGDGLVVEHGPFAEERFANIGPGPWTLLIQAVDHHVPAVAALLPAFRFIPNWRVDDVMVSYASDGGGVGAHFDQYDVFLVQGLGQRRWRVGPRCDDTTPLLPHADLQLLAGFVASGEWVLDPGDILYVPPGFAHEGIAVGDDCMTYSIGFRAPAQADLVAGWAQEIVGQLAEDFRYADADLAVQANPGEILPAALARLHALAIAPLSDPMAFARWFGTYVSAPKYAEIDWRPDTPATMDDIRAAWAGGVRLCRNPASRFVFVRGASNRVTLFVDGADFDCSGDAADLAERLAAQDWLVFVGESPPSAAQVDLLRALLDQGSVAFDDEEDA